ncbi:MAG: anthranilate synthase component I family protein [Bacteroidia bacterium]
MLKKRTYLQHTATSDINIHALDKRFDRVCVLDSNIAENGRGNSKYGRIIAVGVHKELIADTEKGSIDRLRSLCNHVQDWIFGYISYDVKNDIELLSSENEDGLGFPALHFFVPRLVICQTETESTVFFRDNIVSEQEADEIFELTFGQEETTLPPVTHTLEIQARIRREHYLSAVARLKDHIRQGDLYEVNFCQEFYAEDAHIDPASVYKKLNEISSAPFSVYGKFGAHYVLCASPERFIQKSGNKLISQPIKGTAKRSQNKVEDEKLKQELHQNKKERSENVMIVDLVRNDLSRVAKKGTVNVDELFGIYSFKQVHQMISTVSCEVADDISITEILRATFPMGSMTGAPKVSAMKLIEQFESTRRGLYSGAIGYMSPNGDFDFNVVIRSILYNSENNYLSFMAGSAITDGSDPEKEYEECLLKAKAMFEVLGTNKE